MEIPQPSRRRFLGAAASTLTACAIIPRPARAATIEMKFAHDMPVEHPLHSTMVRMWNAVKRDTGGRLDVKVFPANQLGSDPATLSMIRTGAVGFTCLSGPYLSMVPAASLEAIPFAFATQREALAAMDGALGAHIRHEMETAGLHAFPHMFDLGTRQITSSSHPIRNADDLANFKLRTPPAKIFVEAFQALGAAPTPINFNELYVALQTHVVDGLEQSFSVIETSRFYEVQKYLSITNHIWAGWWLLTSNDTWNSLPRDVQAVVEHNAATYAMLERRDANALNAALADKLRRRGMQLNVADTASFKARLKPAYARWRDQFGTTAWAILEAQAGRLA
jgi:TRAP-type transport system periplasmic protein